MLSLQGVSDLINKMHNGTEWLSCRAENVPSLSCYFKITHHNGWYVLRDALKKIPSAGQELNQRNLPMSSLSSKCTELEVVIFRGSHWGLLGTLLASAVSLQLQLLGESSLTVWLVWGDVRNRFCWSKPQSNSCPPESKAAKSSSQMCCSHLPARAGGITGKHVFLAQK